MRGPGQDSQETAGEAAGPAPAPAPDVEGLGAAPAGRDPTGVQGGQCSLGQRSQEQELSGKGTMWEAAAPGCRCVSWGEVEGGKLPLGKTGSSERLGAAFAAGVLI